MRDLPRSAALAAWGSAVLFGAASIDDAVTAVQGEDLPHAVDVTGAGLEAPMPGLVGLIGVLRRLGVSGLRLHLPAPGDVAGLPGPSSFIAEAVSIGECVVTEGAHGSGLTDGQELALTPMIVIYGPEADLPSDDRVVEVTWIAAVVRPTAPPGADGGFSACEKDLKTAIFDATANLEQLDVASWREDFADNLSRLRRRSVSAGMPPGTPGRAAVLLDFAWRVQAVLELAASDDGGAVNGWEGQRRRDALRGIGIASRHAVVAAVNASLEPARRD